MVFGDVTGLDPRFLGKSEIAAAEVGITPSQAGALQKVAYDELTSGAKPRELKKFRPTSH